jgi:hypothetical protein
MELIIYGILLVIGFALLYLSKYNDYIKYGYGFGNLYYYIPIALGYIFLMDKYPTIFGPFKAPYDKIQFIAIIAIIGYFIYQYMQASDERFYGSKLFTKSLELIAIYTIIFFIITYGRTTNQLYKTGIMGVILSLLVQIGLIH